MSDPLQQKKRRKKFALYFAYAVMIYWIGFILQPELFIQGYFISLIASPICMGLVVPTLLDPNNEQPFWRNFATGLGLTVLFTFLAVLFQIEAWICAAMAIPLFIPLIALGVFLARLRNGKKSETTLKASLILLPLLAIPAEAYITYPAASYTLRTEIIIDAPPEVIWQHTVEIPEIQPDERIWTFSHMLLQTPQPVSAVLKGDVRQLVWTKGVRFQEIVTERVENQRLAWDFSFNDLDSLAAFDPHVSPNSAALKVSDGFYEITDIGHGQSLLVLETHYRVASPFNAYLEFWGDFFLSDFHNSVLAVIKTRSEGST